MTVVPYTAQPELELVPRIEGWKPIAAARVLSAADRRKKKDCSLCQAGDKAHALAWEAYGEKKDAQAAVKAAQDAGLADVNAKLVANHFSNHNYDQPAPIRRLSREEMLALGEGASERGQRMILAVYRQRSLSTRQLIQLFVEPETKSDGAAKASAIRLLNKLRHRHLLYPFRVEDKKSPEVYYALGRWAVPLIEEHEGRLTGQGAVTRRDQVKTYQLQHDIDAADVFVQMRRQLYTNRNKDNMVTVDGTRMSLHMPTECWWGSRSLAMGYRAPEGERVVIPDGFAALHINDGRHRQSQLPFFMEWDSGHKTVEDTVQQILNYLPFTASGAPGKRFPQLAVDGYRPPVLIVAGRPTRVQRLVDGVREAVARRGIDLSDAPRIFITDRETLNNQAWAPGAWIELLHGQPGQPARNLAEQLCDASQVLIERGHIHWRTPLELDPDGAYPSAAKLPAWLK